MTFSVDNIKDEIQQPVAQFLSDLVRIRSYSAGETQVVARIKEEMERVGFDETRVDAFGNIIGRIGTGPRIIALDAHIDTVEIGNESLWEFPPFSGEIRDGFLLGRGASDQKGGMAAMVYAGAIMKKYDLVPPDCTVLMTGTVSEEDCDGLCWRYLIEQENIRPEVCILTEPTNCRLYRGHRGRMEIIVQMPGVSAHGSAPERGINAISRMADIIKGMDTLAKNLAEDSFLGKGTVTISRILSTAPSLCSVADSCEIYLDRRLTWGETPESAVAEIQALDHTGEMKVLIPKYEKPTHTGYVYPVEKVFPAWKTAEDHPAVTAGIKTHVDVLGSEPVISRWTFSTNGVAVSGIHGIPCIGFGPGREKWAHAPNERMEIAQLVTAALFYAGYPRIYCESTR